MSAYDLADLPETAPRLLETGHFASATRRAEIAASARQGVAV